ncbi:Uncharacterized membrane protein [Halorubrum ezzemoulense]|jgi:uncharacterized membrane protein|uniref:Uncharacterized membrane protein n=5 Tax=Halorubrum TaxID=56688 RepID=A0A238URR5_HALEZ|nr:MULTISPECIES: SHOCT domain-containing protein [Halorubrum]MDB2281656.1 SHOCT domain-containing protein [Halorubrum ezzemoulense]MDB9253580.1 SHOCT domain-containing protein [Halorubrum ezzemoulense]MDB9254456.1 SHOCT domain-containing protein [Halorubrum ezzemoulense]MDB9275167.1 SHOCT domain-containing protein [Halorubrum ezzemoulense]MDB9278751.1 SHOCT domain-containing protein [Halorubrum ezzemoulense]
MSVLELPAATLLMGGIAGSGTAGGMGGMGGMGGATGLVSLVAVLAVAALLGASVVGVRALARDADGESKSDGADETAVERLQRRYAEGELTEAEFERALERELGSDGTTEAGAGPVGEPDPAREAKRAR